MQLNHPSWKKFSTKFQQQWNRPLYKWLTLILLILILLAIFLPLGLLVWKSDSQPDSEFKVEICPKRTNLNLSKKDQIKQNFKQSWDKFIKASKGADEIDPITGNPKTTWGGWGVTVIDSLDTLYLMNLTKEFDAAAEMVSKVDFTKGNITTTFFEVVIRNLGGLISIYDLTNKPMFLNKAKELADVLMDDFQSPLGLPYRNFSFSDQVPMRTNEISLASVGSCQLEFSRLSLITGDDKYREIALKVYDQLDKVKSAPGEFHKDLDINTGKFKDLEISIGIDTDSFYEYLLKVAMLLGPDDPKYQSIIETWERTMDVLQSKLLKPCYNNRICLGKLDKDGHFVSQTHHLNFFVPGMLILGGDFTHNDTLVTKGFNLLDSFLDLLPLSPTGLIPDIIEFHDNSPMTFLDPSNRLRPELIESIFYAYRHSHLPRYRDLAWSLYQAFESYSCVNFGYADYKDITNPDAPHMVEGNMPSFFYAETYKYLYLTFANDDLLPLDNWVLNTEAHPFKLPPITNSTTNNNNNATSS